MEQKTVKTALMLEYFTVGYNILEAVAYMTAGILASSIALTGFGLDSMIESLSGFVLIRRLKRLGSATVDEAKIESRAGSLASRSGFWGSTCFMNR